MYVHYARAKKIHYIKLHYGTKYIHYKIDSVIKRNNKYDKYTYTSKMYSFNEIITKIYRHLPYKIGFYSIIIRKIERLKTGDFYIDLK